MQHYLLESMMRKGDRGRSTSVTNELSYEREARSSPPVSSIYSIGNNEGNSSTISDNTVGFEILVRTLDGFDHHSPSSLHNEEPSEYSPSLTTIKIRSYDLEKHWGGLWLAVLFSILVLKQ